MLSGSINGVAERKLLFRGKWLARKMAIVLPCMSCIETNDSHVPSLLLMSFRGGSVGELDQVHAGRRILLGECRTC